MKLLVRNPWEFREMQLQKDLTPKEDRFLFKIYTMLVRIENSEARVEESRINLDNWPLGEHGHFVEEELLVSLNQQTRLLMACAKLNALLEVVHCVFDDFDKVGDLFND